MDPLAALLAGQPLRLSSASDLHSRITLLEDLTRACCAELQRRPSHCQEPPLPQPAAASSSCMLLLLGDDEVGLVAHELCDPLRPLAAVNLGSTAKGLRMPMQAALKQLRQHHQEAEAFAALAGLSILQLRNNNSLRLGIKWKHSLTLAHWRTLGTLIGCGSLPMLENLQIEGDECGSEGVALLAAGLHRGGLPSLLMLCLSSSQIGDQAASALASALTIRAVPALDSFHFYENRMGDVGTPALIPALRQLPLTTLCVCGNDHIDDQFLAALIAQPMTGVPLLESLQVLDLCQSHITDAGCAALASALLSGALPALTQVDLREVFDEEWSPAHIEVFEARISLGPVVIH